MPLLLSRSGSGSGSDSNFDYIDNSNNNTDTDTNNYQNDRYWVRVFIIFFILTFICTCGYFMILWYVEGKEIKKIKQNKIYPDDLESLEQQEIA